MRTLLTLLLFTLPGLAAPVPKALKKPANPLAGEWDVVEWHIDDSRMLLSDNVRWSIEGDALTVTGKKEAVPSGFLGNVRRTIRKAEGDAADAYDYTILPNDDSSPSLRPAVLEVTANTFKICMSSRNNGPRPAACVPAEGTIMYVLKRADAK